jgi:16S rRNA processing protein RimM
MYQPIGYFSKTQGLKGHLQLNITDDFDIEQCGAFMVELSSGTVPQFIKEFRENKNGYVICLDNIDSIEKAKVFVGKKVLVDEAFIYQSELPQLIGYLLVDEKFGTLGPIEKLEDTGTGLLLSVNHNGKQILLPFNDDFINRIDEEKKEIFYLAPDGLIQMYL